MLCVKDNHPELVESFLLAQAEVDGSLTPSSSTESREEGHGRTEVRRCWAFDAVDRFYKASQWADLKSFAIVECKRIVGRSKTAFTGASTSSLVRISQLCVRDTPPTTWPSFGTS